MEWKGPLDEGQSVTLTNPLLLVESPNFISDVSDDDVNDDVDEEDKYDDHMRYYWGKLVIYPFHF